MTTPNPEYPLTLITEWSEPLMMWEVTVWRRGEQLGATQVKHLADLGQTVHDYVSLSDGVPLTPDSALEESLLPKALPASVEDTAQEIVHNFICPCPDVGGMPPYPCPNARQVAGIVEQLDAADMLVRKQHAPSTSDTDFKVDERVEYLSGMPYLGRIRTIVTGDPETGTTWYVQLDGTNGASLAVTDRSRLRRPQA